MSETSAVMRGAVWNWVQAGLLALAAQPIHLRSRWKLEASANGYSGTSELVPDFKALVQATRSQLSDLPETDVVIAAMRDVPEAAEVYLASGSNRGDPKGERFYVVARCLAPIATAMLAVANDPAKLLDRFEDVYQQLEQFLYHYEELSFSWAIHLSTITSEIDGVQLSDTVRVRRATPDEQERAYAVTLGSDVDPWLWMNQSVRLPPWQVGHDVPKVVIEILERHTLPRGRPDAEAARTLGRRVIESLRLADKGAVTGHTIWLEDPSPFTDTFPSIDWFDLGSFKTKRYPQYVLTARNAELLARLFPVVKWPRIVDSVGLARQRLQYSLNRDLVVDPILDCWIGLESMFLDGGAELSFRAALRIARYLGATPDERRDLFELAKRSYNARSAIAHGDVKKINKLDRDLIDATSDLLRRTIRKALLDGHPPNLKALDMALLD